MAQELKIYMAYSTCWGVYMAPCLIQHHTLLEKWCIQYSTLLQDKADVKCKFWYNYHGWVECCYNWIFFQRMESSFH